MSVEVYFTIGMVVGVLFPCVSIPVAIGMERGYNGPDLGDIMAIVGFSMLAALFAIPLWPLVITSGIGFGIWKGIEYAQSSSNRKS